MPFTTPRGTIACGHPVTARAGAEILADGGNAFDAAVAAFFAACVAEPVLASLAGGGFLLARRPGGNACVYDFFAHTPGRAPDPAALDFHPIDADFGTARQEFHIGLGAAAVPGCVRGVFDAHRELGRLPMGRLVAPAVTAAREGVEVNPFQAYVLGVISPIYRVDPAARAIFGSESDPGAMRRPGERLRQRALADTLELLAREGDALFYEGEIGRAIAALCRDGGQLTHADLIGYRTERRAPLQLDYRGARLLTNPPPSSGGLLLALALKLLEAGELGGPGDSATLARLAAVMGATNRARVEAGLTHPGDHAARVLDPAFLSRYREEVWGRGVCDRGTTHISAIDAEGNIASLTVSNGEGCGHLIPDTGIMLNNMLGEEDLNPDGFHRWRPAERLTSMMAPSLVLLADGRHVALGSGGSNRIRTALLQVLVNLVDHELPLEAAVAAPRLHYERGVLNLEDLHGPAQTDALLQGFPQHVRWPERNMFFGGVHAVVQGPERLAGVGDPRRDGVALDA